MLTITFETDNAGFHVQDEEYSFDEDAVSDAIRDVARAVADGFTSGRVIDPNGNHVGDWSLTDSDR